MLIIHLTPEEEFGLLSPRKDIETPKFDDRSTYLQFYLNGFSCKQQARRRRLYRLIQLFGGVESLQFLRCYSKE